MEKDKPIGVIIIAVLILISSILLLVIGIYALMVFFILGLIWIVFGLIGFFISYGLLKMEDWAWWAAILIYGVGLLLNFLSFNLILMAIDAFILIYILLVAHKFGDGHRATQEEKWLEPAPAVNKDEILTNLFGKENIQSQYNDPSAEYSCPKCGSQKIEIMFDGSGYCGSCKSSFIKPKKKSS